MAYATYEDVQALMLRDLTEDEQSVCTALLDQAGRLIDKFNASADVEDKKDVSCNMVKRAIENASSGIPMGATQGSMSGLGYSQSFTISGGGSVGDLYLSRNDKRLLGYGSQIGSYSPIQELVEGSI